MKNINIDPQHQKKAKEYARINRRLYLVELAWNGIYAFVWLFSGLSFAIKDFLFDLNQHPLFLVAGFIIIYSSVSSIIEFPLSYYSEFILPHRYEMSNQTLKEWIFDQIKGLLISAPIGILLAELIYLILRAFPNTWWLWSAGMMLVVTILFSTLFPILISPLFNKYIPLGKEHQDLEERLLKLAAKTNTKVQGVYKYDMSRRTKAANAALTGIGKTKRIILGDTLINEFEPDEIETVLAHELGHQVHNDIPVGIIINTFITMGGFYLASLGLSWGVNTFNFNDIADIAALPVFIITMGIYGLISMPLTNAYSRMRERRADKFALEITGKSKAYAAALKRLANQNLSEVDPEPWVEFLLHSHPALRKRIQMAQTSITHE